MCGSEITIIKARQIWREWIALDEAPSLQMVVLGLAPHLEGDQVSDHPVAHIIGQSACIWVGDQLFGHPGHYLGQLLVQN